MMGLPKTQRGKRVIYRAVAHPVQHCRAVAVWLLMSGKACNPLDRRSCRRYYIIHLPFLIPLAPLSSSTSVLAALSKVCWLQSSQSTADQATGLPSQVCGLFASYCCYGKDNAPVVTSIPDGPWPPGPFPIPAQIANDSTTPALQAVVPGGVSLPMLKKYAA